MMKTLQLSLAVLFIAGCATSPPLRLDQIQPKRVFALTKPEVFETVRFFGIKEGFRLDSFEQETGRVIGHRSYTPARGGDNKTVIMHLHVTSIDSTHTEVLAKFAFSYLNDALSREEENILTDAYLTLFGYLERKAE